MLEQSKIHGAYRPCDRRFPVSDRCTFKASGDACSSAMTLPWFANRVTKDAVIWGPILTPTQTTSVSTARQCVRNVVCILDLAPSPYIRYL